MSSKNHISNAENISVDESIDYIGNTIGSMVEDRLSSNNYDLVFNNIPVAKKQIAAIKNLLQDLSNQGHVIAETNVSHIRLPVPANIADKKDQQQILKTTSEIKINNVPLVIEFVSVNDSSRSLLGNTTVQISNLPKKLFNIEAKRIGNAFTSRQFQIELDDEMDLKAIRGFLLAIADYARDPNQPYDIHYGRSAGFRSDQKFSLKVRSNPKKPIGFSP